MTLHDYCELVSSKLKKSFEQNDLEEYNRLVILLRDTLNDYLNPKINK